MKKVRKRRGQGGGGGSWGKSLIKNVKKKKKGNIASIMSASAWHLRPTVAPDNDLFITFSWSSLYQYAIMTLIIINACCIFSFLSSHDAIKWLFLSIIACFSSSLSVFLFSRHFFFSVFKLTFTIFHAFSEKSFFIAYILHYFSIWFTVHSIFTTQQGCKTSWFFYWKKT